MSIVGKRARRERSPGPQTEGRMSDNHLEGIRSHNHNDFKSSSRRLVELGRLGAWGCGSSGGAVPSPEGDSGHPAAWAARGP